MPHPAQEIARALRQASSSHRARVNRWFFKTGPGQYGEGDRFLGVSVPDIRSAVRKHPLSLEQSLPLLRSPWHECRLAGALAVVRAFETAEGPIRRGKVFRFYLKHRKHINNWDIVDSSGAAIVGTYCLETHSTAPMLSLARSSRHWDRRIAMVATHAFTRAGQPEVAFRFARLFLSEDEDLMHKVTGWMLREAGKKDVRGLRRFIARHGRRMPRTMLRYSIEKFSAGERKRILTSTA